MHPFTHSAFVPFRRNAIGTTVSPALRKPTLSGGAGAFPRSARHRLAQIGRRHSPFRRRQVWGRTQICTSGELGPERPPPTSGRILAETGTLGESGKEVQPFPLGDLQVGIKFQSMFTHSWPENCQFLIRSTGENNEMLKLHGRIL